MKKIAIVAGLAVLVSACSTHTFIVSKQPASSQPALNEMQHFFVSGLAQSQEVNAHKICGENNVAKVQTQQTFLNGFLGFLSQGIYTPRDIRVYCK